MVNNVASREEYSVLYERVEEAFEPEEMNRDALEEWLRNPTLADQFALTKELDDKIEEARTIQEVKDLGSDIRTLPVHKETLQERAMEKISRLEIEFLILYCFLFCLNCNFNFFIEKNPTCKFERGVIIKDFFTFAL